MEVQARQEGKTLVLTLSGELDLAAGAQLQQAAARAWEAAPEARNLVVDLREVTFLDSSGLGALYGRLREARLREGRLSLVGPRESVRRVLERGGLLRLALVTEDVREAVRRVS